MNVKIIIVFGAIFLVGWGILDTGAGEFMAEQPTWAFVAIYVPVLLIVAGCVRWILKRWA